jgi:type II secretory pathway pseudopilin PulG
MQVDYMQVGIVGILAVLLIITVVDIRNKNIVEAAATAASLADRLFRSTQPAVQTSLEQRVSSLEQAFMSAIASQSAETAPVPNSAPMVEPVPGDPSLPDQAVQK